MSRFEKQLIILDYEDSYDDKKKLWSAKIDKGFQPELFRDVLRKNSIPIAKDRYFPLPNKMTKQDPDWRSSSYVSVACQFITIIIY